MNVLASWTLFFVLGKHGPPSCSTSTFSFSAACNLSKAFCESHANLLPIVTDMVITQFHLQVNFSWQGRRTSIKQPKIVEVHGRPQSRASYIPSILSEEDFIILLGPE